MKEIKFRAWDGENMLNIDHWTLSMICEHVPENHVIMQSTGLKDKNGKDLDWWEDDILQPVDGSCRVGVITYNDNYAEYELQDEEGMRICSLGAACVDGWKKEGNIHENPEQALAAAKEVTK